MMHSGVNMRSQLATRSTTCKSFTRRPMAFAVRPAGKSAVLTGFSGFRRSSNLDNLGYSRCKSATLQAKVHSQVQSSRSGPAKAVAPTRMMFERFTEKAIKVVMLAQEEARRLGHNFVGTEQILLGLIGESTGIAAKVLKSMGVSLKDARVEVEKIIGRGSGFVAVEIPFTPRAKRVLELSLEEARQLGTACTLLQACSCCPMLRFSGAQPLLLYPGHNYIGTEHILLGLLREGEGVAARVMETLGADPGKIRTAVSLAMFKAQVC